MPVETRAPRRAPGVLRRRRDGDQGAVVDGPRVRAARLLLPRDRAQPARGRPLPRAGRGLRRRRRRRARRRAAHALGPRLGPRGGRRPPAPRAGSSSTRCARSSPRCTTRPRCGPARATRSSTSATPATTRPPARSRWRPTPCAWSSTKPTSTTVLPTVGDPSKVALLAQTTLSHARLEGRARPARARRSPSCGPRRATTSASPPPTARPRCTAIAAEADAIVVIGSANSSNTLALAKVAQRRGLSHGAAHRRPRRARRRRARRRRSRGRHRRRERTGGPRAGGDRAARARPRASSRCTSPTRTSTSRRRRELRELDEHLRRRRTRAARRSRFPGRPPAARSPTIVGSTRPTSSPGSRSWCARRSAVRIASRAWHPLQKTFPVDGFESRSVNGRRRTRSDDHRGHCRIPARTPERHPKPPERHSTRRVARGRNASGR